jgi:D-sedoheptulose 7-phosphate isomerase
MMKDLVSRFRSSSSTRDQVAEYLEHLTGVLSDLPVGTVAEIVDAIEAAAVEGSTVFFLGNGGSASITSHFVNDLVFGLRCEGHPTLRACGLADNLSVVTALANDEGFERCFVIQLEDRLQPDDVVFALSVSGNSPNVVEALRFAKGVGARTIVCTGFEGGDARLFADIDLHLDLATGEYGPAEDVFMILDHLIYSCLRFRRRNRL